MSCLLSVFRFYLAVMSGYPAFSLWLPSLSTIITWYIHVAAKGILSLFLWRTHTPWCVCVCVRACMKDNCFTELCWFLPSINMSQPWSTHYYCRRFKPTQAYRKKKKRLSLLFLPFALSPPQS